MNKRKTILKTRKKQPRYLSCCHQPRTQPAQPSLSPSFSARSSSLSYCQHYNCHHRRCHHHIVSIIIVIIIFISNLFLAALVALVSTLGRFSDLHSFLACNLVISWQPNRLSNYVFLSEFCVQQCDSKHSKPRWRWGNKCLSYPWFHVVWSSHCNFLLDAFLYFS